MSAEKQMTVEQIENARLHFREQWPAARESMDALCDLALRSLSAPAPASAPEQPDHSELVKRLLKGSPCGKYHDAGEPKLKWCSRINLCANCRVKSEAAAALSRTGAAGQDATGTIVGTVSVGPECLSDTIGPFSALPEGEYDLVRRADGTHHD